MKMLTCSACSHILPFDPAKYPAQMLSFKCPKCKGKISHDNRKAAQEEAPAAKARPAAPDPPQEEVHLIAIPAELLQNMPPLPEKTAFMVAQNGALAPVLKEGLEEIGFYVKETFTNFKDAVQPVQQDLPGMLLLQAEEIPAPPYGDIMPLIALPPTLRRRIFVALLGGGVKTLDGNAAFFYQVDCLVGAEDLPKFHHHILSALTHELNLGHALAKKG